MRKQLGRERWYKIIIIIDQDNWDQKSKRKIIGVVGFALHRSGGRVCPLRGHTYRIWAYKIASNK